MRAPCVCVTPPSGTRMHLVSVAVGCVRLLCASIHRPSDHNEGRQDITPPPTPPPPGCDMCGGAAAYTPHHHPSLPLPSPGVLYVHRGASVRYSNAAGERASAQRGVPLSLSLSLSLLGKAPLHRACRGSLESGCVPCGISFSPSRAPPPTSSILFSALISLPSCPYPGAVAVFPLLWIGRR